MHCSEVQNIIDDYLDGDLSQDQTDRMIPHVRDCQDCGAELEARGAIRSQLKALPVIGPAEGFLVKAVQRAADENRPMGSRRRTDSDGRRMFAVRGAIAASVALVFVIALMMTPDNALNAPSHGFPEVTLAAGTVTPVKLLFSSEQELDDARLTIQLPEGVELVGYDNRSNLSWTTDLEPGKNVLRLPLVGRMTGSDQLVARLEHPDGTKTFRLQVTVN